MIDAGRLAFERMGGCLAGRAWPGPPAWRGPVRSCDAERLAALFVLVFGDDGAGAGCIRPSSRAKLALEKAAGVTP